MNPHYNHSPDFQFKILGAADSVTGSCLLLKAAGKNILIDCGIFQGKDNGSEPEKNNFPFNPEEIHYLLLTHTHIDHSGRIPQLIDRGFKGEILCHHATVDLLPVLLEDSFKLNRTIKYKSSTGHLMENVMELSWGFEYNRWNRICKGIRFRLLDAGHILGSATIQFDMDGQNLVFSGDIGNKNTGIIRDPVVPDQADILVLESTYGGRSHAESGNKEKFKEIIQNAIKDGGKVLIPAFAVGRTQEIIYQLNDLVERGEIQNIPTFVDSPMGIKITELYRKHTECFDEETLRRLHEEDDPLDFENLFAVKHYRDSIQLDDLQGPGIIIAGSGMCTGGRIINHLENLIEDKTTDIIFVGFQAQGTLGADILKFSKREDGYVVINGGKRYIRGEVHQISGFSAHADHDGLLNWVEKIEHKPRAIYLNHGEPEAQIKLKTALRSEYKNISVVCGFEHNEY